MTMTEERNPDGTDEVEQAAPGSRGAGWVLGVASGLFALVLVGGAVVSSQRSTPAEPAADEPAVDEPVAEEPAVDPPVAEDEDAADPAPEAAGDELTWAPPELVDPERVLVTEDNRNLELDPERDYELVLPDEPLEVAGGVTVVGGRNVVMIGGEISIPDSGARDGNDVRAVYLKNQTGTVHIEGLAITGEGLGEGFNLDQREGAVVQLQNIHVETVQGTREGHHADLIQTWAGPRQLLVDGLTGSTSYQGFFLLPQQFGEQPEPELFDLRDIDITGVEGSGYLLWRDESSWPISVEDVHVSPQYDTDDRGAFLWPRDDGTGSWDDVRSGAPDGGSFVPEGLAGTSYRSPGYAPAG
ncbi:hypothetical protein [Jannaschia sp. R86511]|uniref:hypothetical protein n=1 Tax=Jannaschia sp. R86511 TaxID=3093853 RepID=UPI0036D325AF